MTSEFLEYMQNLEENLKRDLEDIEEDITKELIDKLLKTAYEFKRQKGY